MRRRQKDIWDQPWVMIAVVVGIVAVVAIALVFFFAGSNAGSATPTTTPSSTVTPTPAGSGSGVSKTTTITTTSAASAASSVTLVETLAVSVPAEGVFVKASYIGGYSGKYGAPGALETVRGSGDKVYSVNTTSGTVQATFQKLDTSTRHDLVVEIWKGGKAIASQKNASAYGLVSISSTI
jgi:flagellin-like hook-associated protein FlgL